MGKCNLCLFCSFKEEKRNFVCFNEESEHYGEFLGRCNGSCEDYRPHRYKMPLKEALEITTMGKHYMTPYYKDSDLPPFLVLNFKTNKDMAEWRDAFASLFGYLMKMKEEDGDFE